jgi:hypothetical protein
MNEKMFKIACKLYGDCIGSIYCKENTVEKLIEVYGVDEKSANELADAAFKEWVKAYTD